ncbi:BTAD domain-containing putative transcriptional regulator [Butyrivibrio sp. NC3005]|uniref:BTAD domain-containing putative transcriptional regulator n=1 Tax=Butyrivibrio sp. NC3005 TaxID=1280685 RepID=UPI0003FB729E|nr:BTAD domain-containing putative transcriptional regulator [Butyrivibrio sp. NC3005]
MEHKMDEKKVLHVRMLGHFSLTYDGHEVTPGRNNASKFTQLLQIVWLQGDKGVSKDELVNALYGEDETSNISNSFNNLLYQMRKQMVAAGLPSKAYVKKQKKIFIIDQEVPVWIDVLEFRKHYRLGLNAMSEPERYQHYREAFDLYQGELLPALSTETWVIMESVSLRKEFGEVAKWLGKYLQEQKEYDQAFRIYGRAADIYPEDDWQVGQIESLLNKGDYKGALSVYDKTVEYYTGTLGISVPEKLLAVYHKMSERIDNAPGQIHEIQEEMVEDRKSVQEDENGAYDCSYPSFIDAYHILSRNMERTGYSVYMMLCTLVDYEGKMIRNQDKLKIRSEALFQSIRTTLRRGDTFTKYSNSQFLILLVGTSQEDCDIIYRRMNKKLKEIAGPRADFKYSVVSLAQLPKMNDD